MFRSASRFLVILGFLLCPVQGQVILYQNADFNGWSASFSTGDFPLSALTSAGGVNNAASSVMVPDGWSVTLYDSDSQTGESFTLTGNTENLSSVSFNDRTTSLRVTAPTAGLAVASGNWSSPATWGGSLPGPEQDVIIPEGLTVNLDTTTEVGSILVMGVLRAAPVDMALTCDSLVVTGPTALFEVGTESARFQNRLIITLKGLIEEGDSMMGAKVVGSMNGGTLRIHGPDRVNWTQLNATAAKNAKSITLKEPVDWLPGEEIVIASTDFDAHQAETRIITTVSPDRLTISFSEGLKWMHYGELQNYSNATRSFTLDERAEVGLLSRGIKIQGDAISEVAGFGGHMMAMKCDCGPTPGKGWIQGVELYRMGQKSFLGRYPWHWHNAGDVSGQYIKGSAIHRSYNRVITVHNSNNAVVQDNVGYDHIGHGYFLEDGSETGNTFRHNLGVLTKLPAFGEEVRPHDRVFDGTDPGDLAGESSSAYQLVKLPATFWMTNPDNDFIDNAAAGSDGSGFWMVAMAAPVGAYVGPAMKPGRTPMGVFTGNRAHSNSFSNFGIDGGIDANSHELNNGHYSPRTNPLNSSNASSNRIVIPEIVDFTSFKCRDRSLWFRADTMNLRECRLADNNRATFFAFNQVMYDSLIVGKSANVGNPVTSTELAQGRSMPIPNSVAQFRGHSIYDGPCGIVRVHFAGFGGNDKAIQTNGAAQKSTVHFSEGITFDPAIPFANKVDFSPGNYVGYMWSSGLIDRDGSIAGVPGARLTPDIKNSSTTRLYEDFNVAPGSTLVPEWGAWRGPASHMGLFRLDNKWAQYSSTPIYAMRSDGPAAYDLQTYSWYSQNSVVLNSTIDYQFQYHQIANTIDASLRFVNNGDSVIGVFPNLPSKTYVYAGTGTTPFARASSLSALRAATTESCFMQDNTLYVKLIGKNGGYGTTYGSDFSASSTTARISQNANSSNSSGRTDRVTFADFEAGLDSRTTLTGGSGLQLSAVSATSSGPTTGPLDANDDSVGWTVTSDGDGVNEAVDYHFTFPRQVWREFDTLSLGFSGPKMEVFVVDADKGSYSLGVFDPSDSANIRLNSLAPANYLDHVVGLTLRAYEGDWGGLTVAKPQAFSLRHIQLIDTAAPPFSLSQTPDIDADGIMNASEPAGDVDGDGLINMEDNDSDGDLMKDGEEIAAGRNAYDASDFAIDFNNSGDSEGWVAGPNTSGLSVANGFLSGTATTVDGQLNNTAAHFKTNSVPKLALKIRSSLPSTSAELFFGTLAEPGASANRRVATSYDSESTWKLVVLDLGAHAKWPNQIVENLRLDPTTAAGTWDIDWIRATDGDMDHDGLTDFAEGFADIDNDGLENMRDLDSDGDGVSDAIETSRGTDPYIGGQDGVQLAWDTDSLSPGAQGGSGIWDNSTARWWDSAGTANTVWPSMSNLSDEAVFGGPSGTVTLRAEGVKTNKLTVSSGGYLFTGGPLQFDGADPTLSIPGALSALPGTHFDTAFDISGTGKITFNGGNNTNAIFTKPSTHNREVALNINSLNLKTDDAFGDGGTLTTLPGNIWLAAVDGPRTLTNDVVWKGNRLIVNNSTFGGLVGTTHELIIDGKWNFAGTAPSDLFLRRNLAINGIVSSEGNLANYALNLDGDVGVLTLNHTQNTFGSGTKNGIRINNNSVISIAANGSLGDAGNYLLHTGAAGGIRLQSAFGVTRDIQITGNAASVFDTNGFDAMLTGSITGSATLNSRFYKRGGGRLTYSGNADLKFGGLRVEAGVLALPEGSSLAQAGTDAGHGIYGGAALEVNGGSLTVGDFSIGNSAGSASLTIESGTFTSSGNCLVSSAAGDGVFTLHGGLADLNLLSMADAASRSAILQLNGGELRLNYFNDRASGSTRIHLNGTKIVAKSDKTDAKGFIENGAPIEVLVQAGGTLIDTAGHAIDLNTALLHDASLSDPDGGLVKQGLGTLTLNSANTYTGQTSVVAGRLMVKGSTESTNTLVQAAGSLGGSGALQGALTVIGTLAPGNSVGNLTAGATTLQPGARVEIEIGGDWTASPVADRLIAASLSINATPSSPVTIKVLPSGLTNPTKIERAFPIVQTSGGITGFSANQFQVDASALPELAGSWSIRQSGNALELVFSPKSLSTYLQGFFPDVSDLSVVGPSADPDNDGVSNLVEYAMMGNPNDASSPGLQATVISDSSAPAGEDLCLVIAVLRGAVFAAGPAGEQTATIQDITYKVQGSVGFPNFTSPVSQLGIASDTAPGLPSLALTDWEYRSFKLDLSEGLPGTGFLRVQITSP